MPDETYSRELLDGTELMPYAELKLIQLTHPLHSKHYQSVKTAASHNNRKREPSYYLFIARATHIRLWRYNRRCFARI